ncbi:hypothetical protein FHG89_14725 [Micromonospora orduensis]|uniref:Uncharacterized protein n=1 Tax=Micromonospora orduensis TaxID=1420891 RepID=A0A5C4QR04_9ACTN|nr:hypothetical protein [Micromonospora orduensis]TNH28679.1 hypothetical protein FHG89_14725 [Micromonospora orduensis]
MPDGPYDGAAEVDRVVDVEAAMAAQLLRVFADMWRTSGSAGNIGSSQSSLACGRISVGTCQMPSAANSWKKIAAGAVG